MGLQVSEKAAELRNYGNGHVMLSSDRWLWLNSWAAAAAQQPGSWTQQWPGVSALPLGSARTRTTAKEAAAKEDCHRE